jgi:cysteine desulfurase
MLTPRDIAYLDNNATTAVAPEVIEAMAPFFSDCWGNPSSIYRFGSQVRAAMEEAREQVARLIGAEPAEIVFTSCATESDNAAIHSALETTGRRKIVTSTVEHSAILKPCQKLQRQGIEVVWVPVRDDGSLDLQAMERAIDGNTAICSIMWANNETGVLFPVEEIAALCRSKGVIFHTDAVQAVGKIPIDLRRSSINMLSIAGHKLHAPKGIGALYIRRDTPFVPLMVGGSQEQGKRGGTENTAFIVGLGKACELAGSRLSEEQTRVKALRDRLEKTIVEAIPHTLVNGAVAERLPNTSSIVFEYVESEATLTMLDHMRICASSGSACTTGSPEPSHVLMAMGLSAPLARSAVRFSLSVYTTETEIDKTCQVLPEIIKKLRAISPYGPNQR